MIVQWFIIVTGALFIGVTNSMNDTSSLSSFLPRLNNNSVLAGTNYVIMPGVHEGLTKWLYIVGDVADIVSHLQHAVMIEPCLLHGTISPCYRSHAFPLSKVFDMKNVSKEHPELNMTTWEELIVRKNISNLEWIGCAMNHTRKDESLKQLESVWKETGYTGVKNRTIYYNTFHDCVDEADRMSGEDGEDRLTWIPVPFVLQVHRHGRTWDKPRITLPIQQYIYNQTHRMLNASNYIAFNWRSEQRDWLTKKECVPQFVHMARQWKSHPVYSKYKSILVSDISLNNSDLIWHAEGSTPQWVIKMLNGTFEKLETLQSRKEIMGENTLYEDSIFSTLWDMIISEEAEIFLTCNSDHEECNRCTRRNSHYINEIIKKREKSSKFCVTHWANPNERNAKSICKSLNMKYHCC